MDFLEKDLEEIIFNASSEQLEEKGLFLQGKRFRQLRIGNYGIADLVTAEQVEIFPNRSGLRITIYELKKDKIGIAAFLQAVGYMKGISSFLEKRKFNFPFYFNISLIGRSIDTDGSLCYLPEFIRFEEYGCYFSGELTSLDFYSYKYGFNGIEFENKHGYDLKNKGF